MIHITGQIKIQFLLTRDVATPLLHTAFGTVVHDSSGKWLGQYETEDAAVEMLREMAKDTGGYSDEI